MTRTENLHLPTWEAADRIRMVDFNDLTAKLDEAVGANAAAVADHTAELTKRGNCQLYVTSYTGQDSDLTISFPRKPTVLFFYNSMNSSVTTLPYGVRSAREGNFVTEGLTWTETTLTIPRSSAGTLNGTNSGKGYTYIVVALMAMN